jgi:hypothetical protein
LAERGPIGHQAVYAYVEALRGAGATGRMKRFVRDNESWLRPDTFTWGTIGLGFASLGLYADAAAWHADWRDYEDAEPWMLVNAVEGLRATNRDEEAVEISRHATALPRGFGQHMHHLWLAADDACRGNIPTAKQHLARAGDDELDEDWQFHLLLVQAVIDMAEALPEEAGSIFREVRQRIDEARAAYRGWAREPARRRLYRRCVARIAKYRGTLSARFWHCFRWLLSW